MVRRCLLSGNSLLWFRVLGVYFALNEVCEHRRQYRSYDLGSDVNPRAFAGVRGLFDFT